MERAQQQQPRQHANGDGRKLSDRAGEALGLSLLQGQFWFILRNVLGWFLILSALPVGIALPGPGGVPIFLIGFALATIPGKRRMTTRFMRGRAVRVNQSLVATFVTVGSVAAFVGIGWFFSAKFEWIVGKLNLTQGEYGRIVAFAIAACGLAVPVVYVGVRLGVWGVNLFLRGLPMARRLVRPWMRRRGLRLLPPRRVLVDGQLEQVDEDEIIAVSQTTQARARATGRFLVAWGRRAAIVGITVYIFSVILKPVVVQWPETRDRLGRIGLLDLGLSVAMFALFFAGRSMLWRAILLGFGRRLPARAALRIWVTSELARYIPGAIWQVVGRVRLARPYGIRGSVTSTSQVLELAIFLLANVILAVVCLLSLGRERMEGPAQHWFTAAFFLVPLLALALHPRVFYGIADRVLARLGKPAIANRLTTRQSLSLLALSIVGLAWQSAAIWVLLRGPLDLPMRDAWMLAGAYCLAWTAGFLAIWAPGGLGVREAVLMGALAVALPADRRAAFGDLATLAALSVLLRLWTILSEVLLTAVAYVLDLRGAAGDPTAPGRATPEQLVALYHADARV